MAEESKPDLDKPSRRRRSPPLVRIKVPVWDPKRFKELGHGGEATIYEMKDGAPAVVNFQVRGDTYVVPKVLERGYLALGKERFNFQQGR